MVVYTEANQRLADRRPCAGSRADLKLCLLNSPCCKDHKRTPKECLKAKDGTVPEECYALYNTFFECKRSILDMRTRFRGRKGY
ncbi:unnamed protein product [Bemisia tabaci]|uniref:Cytochrome c oxidase assembly factor 5 n=1 Tax=Bemisia tabaci TaxID=7038 RepID=A0A9P0ADE5_BEMTA|nr:PREDICTED: cytochrome c oxidase assembly factor 5 [Bemisia tabaci]XP_018907441.1 PREDICTED: cytochrome c oxidase assembly factor 5 [Bemisia tabaci]CAH0390324.1 unnamed protein product [Bemisia tabaci]